MVERNLLKTTLMKNYKLDKAKSEARIAKFVEKKRRELLFPTVQLGKVSIKITNMD